MWEIVEIAVVEASLVERLNQERGRRGFAPIRSSGAQPKWPCFSMTRGDPSFNAPSQELNFP